MKNVLIIILALSLPSLALADNIGVAETNYLLSGQFLKIESEGSDVSIKNNSLSGSATTAIGQYGGVSGTVRYNKENYSGINYKSTETAYSGLLFLRDASIGRVGIAYKKSKIDYETAGLNRNTTIEPINISMQTVLLDFYMNDFSLAIERNSRISKQARYDEYKYNASSFSGIWHIHENLLLRISKFAMDADNTDTISIIYQPEIFNRSTSFTFKYLKQNTETQASARFFTVNYYFGTRVSLKSRERKYSSRLYSSFINQI